MKWGFGVLEKEMIQYVVIGQTGSGQAAYDLLVEEAFQKNYSAYVNHALTVLKQDAHVIESSKKQPSSFGNWYAFPYKQLSLIILADLNFTDGRAIQFLKALSTNVERNFPQLVNDGNADFDRQRMADIVRDLCRTHGSGDSKLGQVKNTLESTTHQMKSNINHIIDQHADLERMDNNSNQLKNSADFFNQRGRDLERKMKWRNKMMMILIAIGAFILIIFLAWIIF